MTTFTSTSGGWTLRWELAGREIPSINQVKGVHWAKRKKLLDPWKSEAETAARWDGLTDLPPCNVQLSLPFSVKRRRDPHNYVGTVVKAVVDGLVVAGVWPDDTPEWVTVLEPELRVEKPTDPSFGWVYVYITPRGDGGT